MDKREKKVFFGSPSTIVWKVSTKLFQKFHVDRIAEILGSLQGWNGVNWPNLGFPSFASDPPHLTSL
jgi:hypothetical protein